MIATATEAKLLAAFRLRAVEWIWIWCTGAAVFVVGVGMARGASVVEEISFESGSIGSFGSPAATGWQFDQNNVVTAIETVHASRPAFANGTNQEALVLQPYAQNPFTGLGSRQGALWEKGDDAAAGGPIETLDEGEVFFAYTEFFGDVVRGNQTFKTNFYFGLLGDGNSGEGGFGATAFDSNNPLANTEAGWSWGENGASDNQSNMSSDIFGTSTAGLFAGTRYSSPAQSSELAQNHVGIMVLRQGADAASMFTGSEMELSESGGTFNGGDATNASDPEWGGNSTVITGAQFDKATIVMRRQRSSVDTDRIVGAPWIDLDEHNCTGVASPDSCIYNARIGIKYLRFGTAEITDVNLDGVTDELDRAIVQMNQGLSPVNNTTGNSTGATFFDGDIDNDLDVDADDLAFFSDLGTPGDFNGDGNVNAADFTLWRDNLGAADESSIMNNGDGLNGVDQADYDLWSTAFANGAGSGKSHAIPEPAAASLLLLACVGCALYRPSLL